MALLFLHPRSYIGVGGQHHVPAALPAGMRRGIYSTEGWVGPGPVWTGAGNLAPIGIGSPDRPARSKSIYRLSYRGP